MCRGREDIELQYVVQGNENIVWFLKMLHRRYHELEIDPASTCLLHFLSSCLECSQDARGEGAILRPQGNKSEDKSHILRMAKWKEK